MLFFLNRVVIIALNLTIKILHNMHTQCDILIGYEYRRGLQTFSL